MVTSIPPAVERPLRPVYPFQEANETVVLYEGEVGIPGLGVRPGRLELRCCPSPQVRWTVEPPPDPFELEIGATDLTVRRGDRHVSIAGHYGSGPDGWINGASLTWSDARISKLLVQWMNMPNILGTTNLFQEDSDRKTWWAGRWCIETAGWAITLDSRPDYEQVTADAQSKRLYVLTHTMEVRKIDGGDFPPGEARQLLNHLRLTFSFAFGVWVAPALPQGFDADEQLVWESWGSPICDPARRVPPAWLYTGRPADLTELVSRALPALADPQRAGTTKLQMQLAISAVEQGFVEQRILTAAPGVENLAWSRLVSRGTWAEEQYRARPAKVRLRRLLQEARVPTEIDSANLPRLAEFARARSMDGPAAVTFVRNELVHPQLPETLNRHDGLVEETWLLLRRYLTLLILHDIGYRGSIVDPGRLGGWAGDATKAPWADTLAAPPPVERSARSGRRRRGRR